MQPPNCEALLPQKPIHHSAAGKRAFHMRLADPAHQSEFIFADSTPLIVRAVPSDPEQIGLAPLGMGAIRNFFGLGNRLALSSALYKDHSPVSAGQSMYEET